MLKDCNSLISPSSNQLRRVRLSQNTGRWASLSSPLSLIPLIISFLALTVVLTACRGGEVNTYGISTDPLSSSESAVGEIIFTFGDNEDPERGLGRAVFSNGEFRLDTTSAEVGCSVNGYQIDGVEDNRSNLEDAIEKGDFPVVLKLNAFDRTDGDFVVIAPTQSYRTTNTNVGHLVIISADNDRIQGRFEAEVLGDVSGESIKITRGTFDVDLR